MIGETLGNYRVLKKLGEGGMGVVYMAEHTSIGRKAAVKLLLPELSMHQEIVNRFFNEARATSQIDHPGLIHVFDFGYHSSGSAYIVMEFVSGESLASRLQRGGVMPPDLVVALGRQIASALGAAHERGIVHRDLKPDNVMLVPDRDFAIGCRAKILDFGIAKLAGDTSKPAMQMTRTGAVMGTPMFMSPEQCRGAGEVDPRSDIYALGCMLFMMVTGRPPFSGEGPGDVMAAHLREPAPRAKQYAPGIPDQLDVVIDRLLAKRPDDRPSSMEAVIAELDSVPQGAVPLSRPRAMPSPTLPEGGATTLGGSAGQLAPAASSVASPPAKTRKRMVVGGGLVAALGIGGIAIAIAQTSGEDTRAAASHAAVETAASAPPGAPAPTPTPAPPSEPSVVRLQLASSSIAELVASHGADITKDAIVLFTPDVPPVDTRVVLDLRLRDGSSLLAGDGTVTAHRAGGMTVRFDKLTVGSQTVLERILAEKDKAKPANVVTSTVVLEPKKVRLVVGASMPGAIVYDSRGHRVGKTPYRFEVESDARAQRFSVRCTGYLNASVEVSPSRPNAVAKLERDRSVPPASECD